MSDPFARGFFNNWWITARNVNLIKNGPGTTDVHGDRTSTNGATTIETSQQHTNQANQEAGQNWGWFILRLVLGLSPLLTCAAALELFAWRTGETMPMWLVAKWQSDAPNRAWRGGDGRSYLTYKIARVRELKPDIVALGSSRANSFRGDVFAPYSFYNAGLTAWTFNHYRRFVELMTKDGYAPKVMVVNFDYWMFTPDFDRHWTGRFYEQPTTHFADLKIIVDQLRKDPLVLWRRMFLTDHLRGLHGVMSGDGFNSDGSLFGRPGTPDSNRLLNDGMQVGTNPIELSDHISPGEVQAFQRFVAVAKAHQIALIAIQVPMYAKILNGLNNSPKAGVWRELRSPQWQRWFQEMGVIFFDFADLPGFRDKPEYFIDSIHPDARIMEHVMKIVLADPRVQAVLPKPEGDT